MVCLWPSVAQLFMMSCFSACAHCVVHGAAATNQPSTCVACLLRGVDSYGVQLFCPRGTHNDIATVFFDEHTASIKHIFGMEMDNTTLAHDVPQHSVWQPLQVHSKPPLSNRALLVVCVAYMGLMVLCVGVSVPAGMFMPSIMVRRRVVVTLEPGAHVVDPSPTRSFFWSPFFFLARTCMCAQVGSTFGRCFGNVYLHWVGGSWPPPSAFAVAGATAALSGLFRSPICLMVIMFEATRTMSMHLPVLLASIVANVIAALCKQDGVCASGGRHVCTTWCLTWC